jgi:hypothetical protein
VGSATLPPPCTLVHATGEVGEVKGDQVILHLPGEGDVPLKINGDGTLDAPAFGTFKKN